MAETGHFFKRTKIFKKKYLEDLMLSILPKGVKDVRCLY